MTFTDRPLSTDAAAVLTLHDITLCGWRIVAEPSLVRPTDYWLGRSPDV